MSIAYGISGLPTDGNNFIKSDPILKYLSPQFLTSLVAAFSWNTVSK